MLALLPLLCFILLFFNYRTHSLADGVNQDWRDSFAKSLLSWGLLVLVSTEVLSAFNALTQFAVVITWGASSLGLMIVLLRIMKRTQVNPVNPFKGAANHFQMGQSTRLLLFGFILLISIIGIVALISPPQEGDTLAYHMGRVVHWIQNKSVAHYATPDSRQLWTPPWTEFSVMHMYLLWGGDRLSNLVPWFSLLATAIVASRIANLLGAKKFGQLASALFFTTVSFAIIQATSSLTDLVVSCWVICTAWIVIRSRVMGPERYDWLLLGISGGLGLATKGTYVAYVFPFVIWFLWIDHRRMRFWTWVQVNIQTLSVAVVLVLPMMSRNWLSFGSFMGSENTPSLLNQPMGIVPLLSNSIRSMSLLLASPFDGLNLLMAKGVTWLHHRVGFDVSDPAFILPKKQYGLEWGWPGTNSAPYHIFLAMAAIGILMLTIKSKSLKNIRIFALCSVSGFLLFSAIFRLQLTVRFHLPFFALLAPIAGSQISKWLHQLPALISILGLFLVAAPTVFANPTRPIVPFPPYTNEYSILTIPRELLYFSGDVDGYHRYETVGDRILASKCDTVALRIDSGDLEYLWWVSLQPLQNHIRVEHDLVLPGLEPYRDKSFSPCAVICTVCNPESGPRGNLLPHDYGNGVMLFIGDGETN